MRTPQPLSANRVTPYTPTRSQPPVTSRSPTAALLLRLLLALPVLLRLVALSAGAELKAERGLLYPVRGGVEYPPPPFHSPAVGLSRSPAAGGVQPGPPRGWRHAATAHCQDSLPPGQASPRRHHAAGSMIHPQLGGSQARGGRPERRRRADTRRRLTNPKPGARVRALHELVVIPSMYLPLMGTPT